MIQELQKSGYKVANHICGNVDAIFNDMLGTEADILEIDEKTDVATASAKAAGKTCLLGTLSPTLIRNGTPQEIRNETVTLIRTVKGNPGFIVGPGCALGGDTPIENIKMVVDTAKEYGTF